MGWLLRTRQRCSAARLEHLPQHWIESELRPVWYRRWRQPLDKALVQELGNAQQWTANSWWRSGNLCYKNSRQLQRLCSCKYKRTKLSTTGRTIVVYILSPYRYSNSSVLWNMIRELQPQGWNKATIKPQDKANILLSAQRLSLQSGAHETLMNSMYSHQGRSQGWANRVSEERSGWYAQKLVRQADTTVSEKELWLERSKLTWYHSEWEGTVGSGRTSCTTYTSECYCST